VGCAPVGVISVPLLSCLPSSDSHLTLTTIYLPTYLVKRAQVEQPYVVLEQTPRLTFTVRLGCCALHTLSDTGTLQVTYESTYGVTAMPIQHLCIDGQRRYIRGLWLHNGRKCNWIRCAWLCHVCGVQWEPGHEPLAEQLRRSGEIDAAALR